MFTTYEVHDNLCACCGSEIDNALTFVCCGGYSLLGGGHIAGVGMEPQWFSSVEFSYSSTGGGARIALSVVQDGVIQRYHFMTLLIPDRSRKNQEDFIWCLPVSRDKWNKWYGFSEKYRTITPQEYGAVRYAIRMEGGKVKTILMMPNQYQSDDDALMACAFMRMIEQVTCLIYIVRCTDDKMNTAQMINAVAGIDPELLTEVSDDDEDQEVQAEKEA